MKKLDAQILAANSASLTRMAALERRAADANVSVRVVLRSGFSSSRLLIHVLCAEGGMSFVCARCAPC